MPMEMSVMNQCMPVKLSFTRLTGTMVVPFPGWKVTRSRSHTKMMEMKQTGIAIKNHVNQLGSGVICSKAMMFCGEAIGDAIPPIHAARAIPRIRALANLESAGRLRRIGCRDTQ